MTLPELARRSIEYFFQHQKIIKVEELNNLPKQLLQEKAGTFVSLHRKDGQLRGCIGTFLPTQPSIAHEVARNAVSAAFADPRFFPLSPEELKELEISVDVLEPPEKISNLSQLDPKKYGVIVSAADGRRGLLLPDIEGVESIDDQLSIARQKANINPDEETAIERFRVKRYNESR